MPYIGLLSHSLNKRREAVDCTLRMPRNAQLRCLLLFKNCDKYCKICDFLRFFKFLAMFWRLLQTYVRFP